MQENPKFPKKISIYHNILHKYTFQTCINIQNLHNVSHTIFVEQKSE
nr:MAG TPA: hypothetical protein [Caudoviricetes sp.]